MDNSHKLQGRIAHLILQPRFSGAEILVKELASRQVARWEKVAIIALLPSEDDFAPTLDHLRSMGVEVLVPDRHLNRLESLFFLRHAVSEFQPSCLFAHSVLPGFYSRGSFLSLPCPMVTVLHDGSCNDYFSWKLAFTEKILTSRLSALIAVNPDALKSYGQKIRDASDISQVILNGISLEKFHSSEQQRKVVRRDLGVDDDRKVILQVGRINRVKRQDLTIHAVRNLSERGCVPKVLFAGIIEETDYYEECAKSAFGLDIEFLGARSDVPDLMSAADLLLMPSTQEAHSVAFIEALASGRPIVGSRISSFLPYEGMDGVSLVDLNLPAYVETISAALSGSRTNYPRDMSGFTIERTCEEYDSVALQVMNTTNGPLCCDRS